MRKGLVVISTLSQQKKRCEKRAGAYAYVKRRACKGSSLASVDVFLAAATKLRPKGWGKKRGSCSFCVVQMIDEADRDGDGEINEEEFLRVMRKSNLF